MKMRWKREDAETGLARVGSAPRGSYLHDGETTFARTMTAGGGWRGPVRGWYWTAVSPQGKGVNTSNNLVADESTAKSQATEYVKTGKMP